MSAAARALSAWHANTNGLPPGRLEEIVAAASGHTFVSLQDTRLRPAGAAAFLRAWPHHLCFGFLRDEAGPAVQLLVRASLQPRLAISEDRARHRMVAVDVRLPDGAPLRVATYYAPPEDTSGLLSADLLRLVFGASRVLLMGDLNAKSRDLGCRTSNSNGDVLLEFLEDRGLTVLNSPGNPTYYSTVNNSFDCLDWFIATGPAARLFGHCTLGEDVGSDHLPLTLTPRARFRPSQPQQPAVPRWRTSRVREWEPFGRRLQQEFEARGLLDLAVPATPAELDAAATRVTEAFAAAADAEFPRSRLRTPGDQRLPASVLLLIRCRRRLRRRWRGQNDPETRRQLSSLRGAIQQELRALRRAQVEARARQLSRGPRDSEVSSSRDF